MNAITAEVGTGSKLSDNPTYRALTDFLARAQRSHDLVRPEFAPAAKLMAYFLAARGASTLQTS